MQPDLFRSEWLRAHHAEVDAWAEGEKKRSHARAAAHHRWINHLYNLARARVSRLFQGAAQ